MPYGNTFVVGIKDLTVSKLRERIMKIHNYAAQNTPEGSGG